MCTVQTIGGNQVNRECTSGAPTILGQMLLSVVNTFSYKIPSFSYRYFQL